MPRSKIIPPEGFRLLKRGEIIQKGALVLAQGENHWRIVTICLGDKYNSRDFWPIAQKIEEQG